MAEVVIVENAAAAGALVADEIVRLIVSRPDAVLGLATGSTPLAVSICRSSESAQMVTSASTSPVRHSHPAPG